MSLFCLSSIPHVLTAGPVGPAGSYPHADYNAQGDYLIAGSWKLRLNWQGEEIAWIPPQSYFSHEFQFNGGLADREDLVTSTRAIVCNRRSVQLVSESDAGQLQWRSWQATIDATGQSLSCAINASGQIAVLDPKEKVIWWSENEKVDLSDTGYDFSNAQVAATDDGFWILNRGGYLLFLKPGLQALQLPVKLPSSYGRFRWHGSKGFLAYGSSRDLEILSVSGPTILDRFSPAIAPCEDDQDCGVSVADDGSWLVAGYWGVYGGPFGERQRAKLHLETGRIGGVGLAHSGFGDNGRFIFLGPYDGDTGPTPGLFRSPRYPAVPANTQTLPRPTEAFRLFATAWWQDRLQFDSQSLPEAQEVLVAVIDSGIEADNQSLDFNLWENQNELTGNGIDDDGNGFVDDIHGFDFVMERAQLRDGHGHGTHVAGLIASKWQSGESFSVAANTRLMVLRALDQDGKSNSLDLARAIQYAVYAGAKIINCSWGGGGYSLALEEAFELAAANGALIVTSAGNDRLDHDSSPQIPANFPSVVAIGSYERGGGKSGFSNYGTQSIFMMAPGSDILSSLKSGDLGEMSGTSMASPIFSSSLGLVVGFLKNLRPEVQDESELVAEALDLLCELGSKEGRGRSRCGNLNLTGLSQKLRP